MINLDKTIKFMMTAGIIISGVCSMLIQLRDNPALCSKANDYERGSDTVKKKSEMI